MKESQNNKILIRAIKQNDLDRVKELLANGGGTAANAHDHNKKSALMWAINTNNIDMVNALLKAGANPNVQDHDGNTALIWAMDSDNTDIMDALLKAEANPNAKDHNGRTALMHAVMFNSENTDIIGALLKAGADPNVQDHDGSTALMQAVMLDTDKKDIIDGLLKAKANPQVKDKDSNTPLSKAIDKGDINIIDIFLNNGTDLNIALLTAIQRESLPMTQVLLEKGADPNAKDKRGETALLEAVKNNNLEMTQVLLEKGADPNAKDKRGETALLEAVKNNNLEMTQVLLEKGADPNQGKTSYFRNTALLEAVRKENLEITKALLEKGADPNYKNIAGVTALSSTSLSSTSDPQIKSMLEEASSLHQKLDRKAAKHIQSALKEVSKNKNSVDDIFADDVDDIFADDKYKLNKHISKDLFTKQAQQILEGMKLTFIEKVKSVFQGRDEVVSQKAMKQLKESLKDDVGYKELIAQKVEARHDKQRQHNIMKEFMPASNGASIRFFLNYHDKIGEERITPASNKDIKNITNVMTQAITKDIEDKSNKSLTPEEQKTLKNALFITYKQLALEIQNNIPAEKLNTQQPDGADIILKAAKESSFAKAMEDIKGGKKPELPKGSAAALFVEAIKPLTVSTFKDKVTAETSNKSHQQRG